MSILCATDFSPSSEAAVAVAATLARRGRVPLLLFHAVRIPYAAAADASGVTRLGDFTLALEQVAVEQLDAVAKKLRASGLDVQTQLVVGEAPQPILELSKRPGVEAIVMGTHGRTGAARFFLGSVAEQVVKGAKIPVYVVHALPEGQPTPAFDRGWRLAVVLDGTPSDMAALAFAARLPDETAGELLVVRLVSPPLESARFGIEAGWSGVKLGPALELAIERGLARQLEGFPSLARASRTLIIAAEESAAEVGRRLADLAPTFVVLAIPAGRNRRLRRALEATSLLRVVPVPAICVPEGEASASTGIPTVDSVLIAVDLEEASREGVRQTYGLLRQGGGRVELCYVHERPWDAYGSVWLAPPLDDGRRAALEQRLRALIPSEAEALGITTHVQVLEGATAAEVIAQAAARLETDVVALATHDRRGLAKALRGSVTEAVLKTSHAPTLVVHT